MKPDIEKFLSENSDENYRKFQAKLMPGIDIKNIIGVRVPLLRAFAKQIAKQGSADEFLNSLPHKYYDENNLHGFIISEMKDYDAVIKYIDAFLPYVDNWATCDLMSPKCFKKNRARLKNDIDRWILSDKPYTVRFGIEMAMSHFLDEDFDNDYSDKICAIKSDEYYVNMMIAWFFATALAKQWDSTYFYIENKRLDGWTHNKAIQKALESRRIDDSKKTLLRSLKI